jgi:hypothetical protein
MNDLELQHLRREKWRLEGEPLRTLEEAREFVDSVGMCLMYPVSPMPLLPTFAGAVIGSAQQLPARKASAADPRMVEVEALALRLTRNHFAFMAPLYNGTLLISPLLLSYFYALIGDRKPKQPLGSSQRGKASPLAEHTFRKLEERGPLNRTQLQEQLGGELSPWAIDRVLHELWKALKILPIDYSADFGNEWDVLYRWAPEAVVEGVRASDAEALSALISKYLDGVVAATPEEVEEFFSAVTARSRVHQVLNALLAAREFNYSPGEGKTLITVSHTGGPAETRPQIGRLPQLRRRRNG